MERKINFFPGTIKSERLNFLSLAELMFYYRDLNSKSNLYPYGFEAASIFLGLILLLLCISNKFAYTELRFWVSVLQFTVLLIFDVNHLADVSLAVMFHLQ